jgi:hypothetical protein
MAPASSADRGHPDSTKLALYRVRPGYNRLVTYVQSSPTDQLQPKTSTNSYRKPGDVVDFQQPVLFDVASKKQTIVDTSLFPNPYSNGRIEWLRDSSGFDFEYNQRGHQVYRVIQVDASTGKARAVVDETSKTFIYYNRQAEAISGSGRTYRTTRATTRKSSGCPNATAGRISISTIARRAR